MCLSLTALLIKVGRFHLVPKSLLAKIPLFLHANSRICWVRSLISTCALLSLSLPPATVPTWLLGFLATAATSKLTTCPPTCLARLHDVSAGPFSCLRNAKKHCWHLHVSLLCCHGPKHSSFPFLPTGYPSSRSRQGGSCPGLMW